MHVAANDRAVGRGQRNLEEGNRGDVPRHLPVGSVQHSTLLGGVENPVGLVEVARHEPLAIAAVVLASSAAVNHLKLGRTRVEEPGEERNVEVPPRQDLPEENGRRSETGYDLDTHLPELRLGKRDGLSPRRDAGTRDEAQGKPLTAAEIDAVGAPPAAGLLEQPACLGGTAAVAAPVRSVARARLPEQEALEGTKVGRKGAEHAPHQLGAVDAVGKCSSDELVPERGMTAGPDPDREVLEPGVGSARTRIPGSLRRIVRSGAKKSDATSSSSRRNHSTGSSLPT